MHLIKQKENIFELQHLCIAIRYLSRKGVRALWEALYEDHEQELLAYGIRMSQSRELAEDLVQETFIRALMHTEVFEDLSPKQQRAWLFRTLKNLFFDRCRRAVLEREYAQNVRTQVLEDPGIQEAENTMLLESISPEDRALFQLRYVDGYSAEEISQMMNRPPGTIRSRLSRCRKHLRQNYHDSRR